MPLHIGTHISIAGGLELAFERSAKIGGNTLQIFAKSPRGWNFKPTAPETYEAGRKLREQYKQVGGLIHSNYLINLSKPANEIAYEINSLLHDFEVAHELQYDAVNVHIGKLKGFASRDEAMKNMAQNVEFILKKIKDNGHDDVQFLFENTAGQGSEIGSTLEELGYFWKKYLKELPVKFCIDTAHCRGGGIDVGKRTDFIDGFANDIGIEQLYSIHLNDAKVALGSKLDRHAGLGRGMIGLPALAQVIHRAVEHDRHMYIETPDEELYAEEIEMVKKISEKNEQRVEEFHRAHFKEQLLKKFANEEGTPVQTGFDL